jgi:hypothetical protein
MLGERGSRRSRPSGLLRSARWRPPDGAEVSRRPLRQRPPLLPWHQVLTTSWGRWRPRIASCCAPSCAASRATRAGRGADPALCEVGQATFIAVFRLFAVLYKRRDTMDSLPLLPAQRGIRPHHWLQTRPRRRHLPWPSPAVLTPVLPRARPEAAPVKLLRTRCGQEETSCRKRSTCQLHLTRHYSNSSCSTVLPSRSTSAFDQPQR